MKKFREWNVARVMIVEGADKETFEKDLEDVLENYQVIDLQYSTNDYKPWSLDVPRYSALVLVTEKEKKVR